MYFIAVVFLLLILTYARCDSPNTRLNPSCAYLNQKIYCHDADKTLILEVSQQQLWNRQWATLADKGLVQETRQYSAFLSVPEGLLIQQGGMNPGTANLVHQTAIYDTSTNVWKAGSNYVDPATGASRQIFSSAAVYIPQLDAVAFYGGREKNPVSITGSINATTASLIDNALNGVLSNRGFDSQTLYNIKTNTWSQFPRQSNLPRNNYVSSQTATYHPSSGKIFYLGGGYYISAVSDLLVANSFAFGLSFNTNTGAWFNETFGGDTIPSQRLDHTATLMPNSQDDILIYGGGDLLNPEAALPDHYCFSLNLKTMKWTHHSMKPPAGISGPRTKHAAVLVGTVLFILFGSDSNGNSLNDILLLDAQNAALVSVLTEPVSNSTRLYPGVIAGFVIGIVVGIAILATLLLLFFRKKRRVCRDLPNKESMSSNVQVNNEVIITPDTKSMTKLESEHREIPSFYTPQLASSNKLEEIEIFVYDEDQDLADATTKPHIK